MTFFFSRYQLKRIAVFFKKYLSRNNFIGVISSIIAGTLLFIYLSNLSMSNPQLKNSENIFIVIAIKNISPGTEITESMIDLRGYSPNSFNNYAVENIQDVVGKVALEHIFENEPILKQRVGKDIFEGKASSIIAKEKVALAVPVDEISSVGGGIRPGDRVDLLATVDKGISEQDETKLIFSNLKVIGIGGLPPFGNNESNILDYDSIDEASSLVLEVTPDQAKVITFYSEKAIIRFTLRSKG